VVSTFVRGNHVWDGADVIGQKELGQFVPRQPKHS
jgi:hypothetical protein